MWFLFLQNVFFLLVLYLHVSASLCRITYAPILIQTILHIDLMKETFISCCLSPICVWEEYVRAWFHTENVFFSIAEVLHFMFLSTYSVTLIQNINSKQCVFTCLKMCWVQWMQSHLSMYTFCLSCYRSRWVCVTSLSYQL